MSLINSGWNYQPQQKQVQSKPRTDMSWSGLIQPFSKAFSWLNKQTTQSRPAQPQTKSSYFNFNQQANPLASLKNSLQNPTQNFQAPTSPVQPQINPSQYSSPIGPVKPTIAPPATNYSTPPPTPGTFTTPSGMVIDPSTGSATPPPTVPQIESEVSAPAYSYTNPEYEKSVQDYQKAVSAYQASLPMSTEEEASQKEINRLLESAKAGVQGAEEQAIPMEFITGQQQSIEKRALGKLQPLQDRMALLQAKRAASLEANKFAVEKSQKDVERYQSGMEEKNKQLWQQYQFEKQNQLSRQQFAQTQQQQGIANKLAQDKFLEDKRQFGLQYALDQQKAVVGPGGTGKGSETVNVLQDKINLIDSLINSKGLAGSVGAYGFSRWTPFSVDKAARLEFSAGVNQLVNKETIDTLVNLKARGGTLGALSDQERVLLQSAATKIGSWTKRDKNGNPTGAFEIDEASFKKELNLIKSLANRALVKAGGTPVEQTGGDEYSNYLKAIGQ